MGKTNSFLESIKDEDTSILDEELGAGEFKGWMDTGCYMLNAVLSGSIFGGVPNNKIVAFAGESSTGKTYFVLEIVKNFLNNNPKGIVIYFDTEAAVNNDMIKSRGMDTKRILYVEPDTIQSFRNKALNIINSYLELPEEERIPMLMVLDSLGMLSTSKEISDITDGKDSRDMTQAPSIKAAFRVLTLKLARAKIPMIITNHIYSVIGAYVPTKEVSGGSGLKYAASIIAMLSKTKDKEGTDVVGNIIKVNMYKSRLSKENSKVELKLSYETGLDKYYGLLDLAEKSEIFKRVGNRYELPSGEKIFAKTINENPEKYFTKDILDLLDVQARKLYSYGSNFKGE